MEKASLIRGVDYPRTFQEMDERRRSQARGLLFHRLAQQAVAVGPTPYHSIISGQPH